MVQLLRNPAFLIVGGGGPPPIKQKLGLSFLTRVVVCMMLIRGLQGPQVYALGSLCFLVLRPLYNCALYNWGGLGPTKAARNGPGVIQ